MHATQIIRAANGHGDYPISLAAEYGHLPIVQYLHQLPNVQLNVSNKDGQTPLHLATRNHHFFVVRYLVLWGADHLAVNIAGESPLHVAQASASKNQGEATIDKRLIHFLQQLACPVQSDQQQRHSGTPNFNLDRCELVTPVTVGAIEITDVGDEERLGRQAKGFLSGSANNNLMNAAKEGLLDAAKKALGEGANICYRKNNQNAYEVAQQSAIKYHNQINSSETRPQDRQIYQIKLVGCQQIAEYIRQIAFGKVKQGIEQSQAYHVLAYHQAGAPLTGDLLDYACYRSDSIQIVDYLMKESADVYRAMFDYSSEDSPYQVAKKKKFNQVASYLKYRLSVECTKAIEANDTDRVSKLIRAGASVDMHDTSNLQVALNHQNVKLIGILCDHGVRMPPEWIQSKTIILPEEISQKMDLNVAFRINCSLINSRLRVASASGDLATLIRCQRLSADINSQNCHGSTALLCSVQHGCYFDVVHALVSHGATMLHSNESESMSVIALAKKQKYTHIADYLSQELNGQFLTTILYNDKQSAAKFEALGADFNYQDEQKRTALHYAVQYHGIELVSWLCVRGSAPTIADVNGNYPITEATEKGVVSSLWIDSPTSSEF